MRGFLVSLLLLLFVPFMVLAQSPFSVKAPNVVAVGEPFRVEFTSTEEMKDFIAPAFDGFNVIAGPTVSTSSNIEYINGKLNRSQQFTYTYVLVAEKEGNNQIGAATATIGGSDISTKVLPIEVAKENGGNAAATGNGSSQGSAGTTARSSQGSIASDDILLRATASRNSVYVGEPILVQLKLYTRAQVSGISNVKLAAFNGFWNQELPAKQIDLQRETYNGKIYDAGVIKEFLVFPQKSGTLEIEQMSLDAMATVVIEGGRGASLFDNVFGMSQQVANVPKSLKTSPIKIDVKSLPTGAPASFNGAVGSYTIKGGINQDKISANGSNVITLTVSGKGNFPLIGTPTIDLPGSFELYPSKAVDNYSTVTSNIQGSKTFEFPFIARAEGEYDLSPIEFSYFDPTKASYVTLSTESFKLDVLKDVSGSSSASSGGIVSGVSKEDLKILGKDIRFIKVGDHDLVAKNNFFITSWSYILLLLLIAAIFAGTIIYMNKRIKELRDTVKLKNKKANKVALSRLKRARKFMDDKMDSEFYSEMLRALSGYVGDKLNIEVARLSKDTIRDEMLSRNVSVEDIEQLLATISDCEFAQYAPMTDVKMSDVYNKTLQLIGRLESKL